jgi:acyl-ACP thioesterase
VNNVSFVEWVLESVPSAVLNTAVPVEFEINFLAEAFYEDHVRAACHPQNQQHSEFLHSLTRWQDGRELARARTVWQEVESRPSEV